MRFTSDRSAGERHKGEPSFHISGKILCQSRSNPSPYPTFSETIDIFRYLLQNHLHEINFALNLTRNSYNICGLHGLLICTLRRSMCAGMVHSNRCAFHLRAVNRQSSGQLCTWTPYLQKCAFIHLAGFAHQGYHWFEPIWTSNQQVCGTNNLFFSFDWCGSFTFLFSSTLRSSFVWTSS